MTRIVTFRTRWPVRQAEDKKIEVLIEFGPNGVVPLNPDFIAQQKLSDAEIDEAEYEVLKSIAIIRP